LAQYMGSCLGLLLWGCTPSREALTAGEVGCPPSELSVHGAESSGGWGQSAATWIAECRGRRFVCTEVVTSSFDLDWLFTDSVDSRDSDVSCHEEVTPARSALALTTRESAIAPRVEPPSGGGGFALGSSRDVAREQCETSGHTWREEKGAHGFCSGTAAPLGLEAGTQLTFCKTALCGITISHVPHAKWATAFAELDASLTDKYGTASLRRVRIPSMCRTDEQFDRCVLDGALDFEVRWQWPRGERLRLLLGKPREANGVAALRLIYVKPPGLRRLDGAAL
jgi:hypothetical protein